MAADWRFDNLVRLWIAAEELNIPRLQNEIIDELDALKKAHGCYGKALYMFVYENTKDENPLRMYLTNTAADLTWRFVEGNVDIFLKSILHDLVVLLLTERAAERASKESLGKDYTSSFPTKISTLRKYQVPESAELADDEIDWWYKG